MHPLISPLRVAASRAIAGTLALLCASAAPAQTPAAPSATAASRTAAAGSHDAPTLVDLLVGQAHVIDEPSVRRIAVGNGRVIQATALDERQILVLPEAPGHSTLHLWRKDGTQRSYVFSVSAVDASRALAEVRSMLGDTRGVHARLVGEKVVLDGYAASADDAQRLAEIAKRYPQAVDLVPRVGLERMIAMDVRMIEIRRDSLENIGIRWDPSAAGPTFSVVGDLHRSNALRPGGRAQDSGLPIRERVRPFSSSLGIVSSITSMLNFLVQNGDAVVLAEPRLSCRSGGTARFVAGGELPIPVSGALGQTSVAFKEYGVKFEVAPVAGEGGLIAAKIATEISSVNFDVAVKDVPGLVKRRAETEVNLRENETLVIAGLLTDEGARNLDKVAGAGDLPVLGNLFRSRLFRERRTELVVFITPYFVDGEAVPDATPAPSAATAFREIRGRADATRERVRMLD